MLLDVQTVVDHLDEGNILGTAENKIEGDWVHPSYTIRPALDC